MRIFENGADREVNEADIKRIKDKQAEFEQTEEYRLLKIAELKQKLADTDYIACKIAEGSASASEYEKEIEQRKEWRQEINSLEGAN